VAPKAQHDPHGHVSIGVVAEAIQIQKALDALLKAIGIS
jgi:hypothetical protein